MGKGFTGEYDLHVVSGNAVLVDSHAKSAYGITSWDADTEFIVHARQDIPRLLEEIDRLRHRLATIEGVASSKQ